MNMNANHLSMALDAKYAKMKGKKDSKGSEKMIQNIKRSPMADKHKQALMMALSKGKKKK